MTRFFTALTTAAALLAVPAIAKIPNSLEEPGFTITMPSTPVKKLDQIEGARGSAPMTQYIATKDEVAYMLVYIDYPFEPEPDYARFRTGFLQGINGGKVELEGETKLNGLAGYTIRANKEGVVFVNHVFVCGSRLYQLMVITPAGKPVPPESRTFVESFRLVTEASSVR
jgi:hypothetical protein